MWTAIVRGETVTLTNVLAAPATRGLFVRGPPPPPAGTPRVIWDRSVSPLVGLAEWSSCQFVELPADIPGRATERLLEGSRASGEL